METTKISGTTFAESEKLLIFFKLIFLPVQVFRIILLDLLVPEVHCVK